MTGLIVAGLSLLAAVVFGGGQWVIVCNGERWSEEQNSGDLR